MRVHTNTHTHTHTHTHTNIHIQYSTCVLLISSWFLLFLLQSKYRWYGQFLYSPCESQDFSCAFCPEESWVHMCDMTCEFICVTWLTSLCVWRDASSCMCVTCLIRMHLFDMTHFYAYVWHDSICPCHRVSASFVWFIRLTWPMTFLACELTHMYIMTYALYISYMRTCPFKGVTACGRVSVTNSHACATYAHHVCTLYLCI